LILYVSSQIATCAAAALRLCTRVHACSEHCTWCTAFINLIQI